MIKIVSFEIENRFISDYSIKSKFVLYSCSAKLNLNSFRLFIHRFISTGTIQNYITIHFS